VVSRTCKSRKENGEQCHAAPLRDRDFCLFHDPEHLETVQAARSAGGQRRKREATLATAFDFEGLTSVPQIRRLAYDALSLDNNINRVRALGYLAQVAVTLLEKGELEKKVNAVEAAVGPRSTKKERR